MWLLNASRCLHARATWWKSPNENELLVISASSLFVGARTSQMTGAMRRRRTRGGRRAARRGRPHAGPSVLRPEEPAARDDEDRADEPDREQVDGDRGGAVEVGVPEGQLIRELVRGPRV